MQIWTTPKINNSYLEKNMPVMIREEGEIRESFLLESGPDDLAVVPLDGACRAFYDAVRERGEARRVLFLSSKNVSSPAEQGLPNALVLNLQRLEAEELKQVLRFVLNSTTVNRGAEPQDCLPDKEYARKTDEPPLEDGGKIRELAAYLIKNKLPVMLGFEVKEHGDPILARGICTIREIRGNMLVLHNFKHTLFFRSLRKGTCVRAFFPYKQENKEGIACIDAILDNEITIGIPEKMFTVRDIRIQPSRVDPVGLYILIANEPTVNYPVIDISQQGVGFLCPRDIAPGTSCYFTIVLPDTFTVIITRGTIRHKKESCRGYQYGAEFRLHPWDADNMAKYIMKRERDIIGLLRG